MNEPLFRNFYYATLDEMTETTALSHSRVETHRKTKRFTQRLLAIFPVLLMVKKILEMDRFDWRPASLLLLSSAFLGVAVYFLYGWFYEWNFRRTIAKLVRERWGGDGTPCETSFLEDKALIRQHNLEIGLPWSSLIKVEDRPEAVVLWFDQNIVHLPNRAFANPEERKSALEIARKLGTSATDKV